ncbi:MAG TPA: RDD family protein [Solirubrobacteraceae bacterium]|jgi:uncharacterized RDD family membrane protein YckC
MSGGLTPGDPLGGDEPRREVAPPPPASPEAPVAGGYGGGRVPPGAFAPRGRDELANPYANAEPAEWWRRAVAAIVDGLIVGLASAVVLAILGAILFGALSLDSPGGAAGAIVVVLIGIAGVAIAGFLYAPLIMARTNGQTWGKQIMDCRVVRDDGRPIDFLWAAYREILVKTILLGIVGSFTAGIAYLVNYLWPLFDDRNRALHDMVVASRVVKD